MKKHLIHIPKTAGRAIVKDPRLKERVIDTKRYHLNQEYINCLTETFPNGANLMHARWRDLATRCKQNSDFFAVVRNPWSRLISRWMFYQKIIEMSISFEHFLGQYKPCAELGWHRVVGGWCNQREYVVDDNDEPQCYIMRFEHIDEDINQYFNTEGLLKKHNRSNFENIDYKTFYTEDTKQLVADWYQDDIEFFGFTFEGAATKNIWNNT